MSRNFNGIGLKEYIYISSAMWTEKTKFMFFCWLSCYFIPSEFPYQYQNSYLALSFQTKKLKILIYIDTDIYTGIPLIKCGMKEFFWNYLKMEYQEICWNF